MPWTRNDPDPLEARRRQLAEQERQLAELRRRLTEQLHPSGESSSTVVKPAEPLVWRTEDDAQHDRVIEPATARKRNLARQTQRDMILFFGFALFLIVVMILLWIAYLHELSAAHRG